VAGEITFRILETGIGLMQNRPSQSGAAPAIHNEAHFAEFWISLASLLRSYTALHGMHDNRNATIEASAQSITVRRDEKSLELRRHNSSVTWTRENGASGVLELTEHGTLRCDASDEAMDLVAEQWARELMQHN
jgi:hypothetical protein